MTNTRSGSSGVSWRAAIIALALAGALAMVLAGLITQPADAEPNDAKRLYTVTELNTDTEPGKIWTNSIARDINESGRIAGQGQNPDRQQRAFLWESGQMTDLGVPSGGDLSRARSINASGQVVGEWRPSGQSGLKAFLYEDGQIKDLNTLIVPEDSTEPQWNLLGAQAINNCGQIVGSGIVNSQTHAFVYRKGEVTDLGEVLKDSYSAAWGINNSGDVVGASGSSERQSEAFVYSASDGSVEKLGVPGGDTANTFSVSEAVGINARGDVMGWSFLYPQQNPPRSRAFLYEVGQTEPVFLDPLPADPAVPGDTEDLYTRARDIDETGLVVGWSRDNDSGGQVRQFSAVLWENGRPKDLNDLIPEHSGWQLTDAYAINERGQIVGSGFLNGQLRAFLLTKR
jgi:probable HAF family extracellular repeat protein